MVVLFYIFEKVCVCVYVCVCPGVGGLWSGCGGVIARVGA